MKIKPLAAIILWLIITPRALAQDNGSIEIKNPNASLTEIMEEITNQTNYTFSYSSTAIPVTEIVELTKTSGSLEVILNEVFKNTPISYNIMDDQIVLKFTDLRQVIRGQIIDIDSNQPIVGATIVLEDFSPIKGGVTNVDGNFRIENVPVGRRSFRVDYLGYKSRYLPNILVGSGKEVVLNIEIEESAIKMQEVVVKSAGVSSIPVNEMAQVSARSFSVEETKRFPISVGDPMRLASSFAGVSGTDSDSNEIIIRGNTPRGILWKLEGVEIPSPNHFSAEGASSGGISMFSTQMISRSDFYTGAFAPEYGNATSGVFDVHLRNGNNEKVENTIQAGFLGIDVAFEGPFNKAKRSSFLFNYRYSTSGILTALGLDVQGENEKNIFQDLSFKLNFPTGNAGTFSVFGMGGLSNFSQNFSNIETDEEEYNMGIIGASHRYLINENTFLKTTISYSGTKSVDDFIRFNETPFENTTKFTKSYARIQTHLNKKISARHTLEAGLIYSDLSFNFTENQANPRANFPFNSFQRFNDAGSSNSQQGYLSWKFKINDRLTMVNGLHALRFGLNSETSIEPRSSIKWQFKPNQSVFAGFGIHGRIESLEYYLGNFINEDGSTTDHNRELGLTKASHYVLGYESNITSNIYFKTEVYYQKLYNVPTLDEPFHTAFSTINASDGFAVEPLINEGTGTNYGLEISIERKFADGYFFLANSSLYDAKYAGRDGVKRNSRFDGSFSHHLLGGREYKVGKNGKNNILGINFKTTFAGNKRYTPIDVIQTRQFDTEVRPADRAFTERYKDFFRIDFQISYRKNKPKITSEWRLDIQNLTNHNNVLEDFYSFNARNIIVESQIGRIPILSYRIEF